MDESSRSPLVEAFEYACELHKGQIRKQTAGSNGRGIPYVAHLMGVASLVLEAGGNEEEVVAALLHDGPEDQGGHETLEVIRSRFGEHVASIVEACSDTLETPKPKWQPRKEAYLSHLEHTEDASVFLVSVADKVHNVRAILSDYRLVGAEVWERFTGKRNGTLWYYDSLLEVFRRRAPERCAVLVDELERVLEELHELVKLEPEPEQVPEPSESR